MTTLKYSILTIVAAAALILTLSVSAQQSPNTEQQQQQNTQGAMNSGNMQHGEMMQSCKKNMDNMQQSNAETRKVVQAAKQSNDPNQMRAALEQADKALSGMNEHMTSCMNMMNMMQNMHGMGMMSGEESSSPKR